MTLSTELPNLISEKSTPELTTRPANDLPGLLLPHISVVIPALNEAKNLPYVLPRIPTWIHEVLLVDGHSTDNTIAVARRLRPDICIVPQARAGKGAALQTGFMAAGGDIIVMLDADGSTDPAEIPKFIAVLLTGADYAKGSRFLAAGGTADMTLDRYLGHWLLLMLVRLGFGGHYSDLCYGYNAFWANILPDLDLTADGFEIETMMNIRALRAGLRIVEVPSFEALRRYGVSHLKTIPDGWRVLKTIITEWCDHHVYHFNRGWTAGRNWPKTARVKSLAKARSHPAAGGAK